MTQRFNVTLSRLVSPHFFDTVVKMWRLVCFCSFRSIDHGRCRRFNVVVCRRWSMIVNVVFIFKEEFSPPWFLFKLNLTSWLVVLFSLEFLPSSSLSSILLLIIRSTLSLFYIQRRDLLSSINLVQLNLTKRLG
jgi:hypothetical protein